MSIGECPHVVDGHVDTVLAAQEVLEKDAQRIRQPARVIEDRVETEDAVLLVTHDEIGTRAVRIDRHARTLPARTLGTLSAVGAENDAVLTLSVEQDDAAAVVTMTGEIEYGTAPELRARLLEISQSCAGSLVLDMESVEFLDSTGISLLIQIKQRFDANGAKVVLRRPPARVTRVLEVAGVADLFTIER